LSHVIAARLHHADDAFRTAGREIADAVLRCTEEAQADLEDLVLHALQSVESPLRAEPVLLEELHECVASDVCNRFVALEHVQRHASPAPVGIVRGECIELCEYRGTVQRRGGKSLAHVTLQGGCGTNRATVLGKRRCRVARRVRSYTCPMPLTAGKAREGLGPSCEPERERREWLSRA